MAVEKGAAQWQVVGRSVRGASHERAGQPNQDAIHWLAEPSTGLPLILAVADGHGSHRYFRSETGARLAVETGAQVIYDFLVSQAGVDNLSVIKRTAEEWLPKMLVRRWLEAVGEHTSAHPLSEDELKSLTMTRGAEDGEAAQSNMALAYGATVLIVGVTESFILYMQLGDGEMLTVSDQGEVSKPLPADERLFANETTSLCAPDAWRDFRVCFQTLSHTSPAAILLATDGYPNSFRDETGFLQVGSDILEIIRTDGLDKVKDSMETWLMDSTRAGSGDDVTLGIICRTDVVASSSEQVSQTQSLNPGNDATSAEFKKEEDGSAALSVRGSIE